MTNEFIKLLKPQNIFKNKIRLGPTEDGGYVLPEFVFEECDALFTYGVGYDSRFEEAFSTKYKKPSYLFDHTIRVIEPWRLKEQKEQWRKMDEFWEAQNCWFFPHGLGFKDNCKDFYDDYKLLGQTGYTILKIDIEGGEYEYFLTTDVSKLDSTVMAISLEVHWINEEKNNADLVEILKRLDKSFILCHIHGNNWGELWEFEGKKIPITLELSFVNRKFIGRFDPDDQPYPIVGLDISNHPGVEDYKLDFLYPTKTEPQTNAIESVYKQVFSNIYRDYGFGGDESHSGPGSTLEETKNLRESIVKLAKEKGIKTIVDIPCGDFNWMKEIVFRFERYSGGDIVPECIRENNEKYSNSRIKFFEHNILTDPIPDGDLLIVRDIIGHFPINDGKKIVENILKSNCKYLLSTTWYNINDKTYYQRHDNRGADYGNFYPVNLMSEPFNLPDPETYIVEDVVVDGYDDGNRKVLGFWNLEKIKNGMPQKIESINVTNKDLTIVTGLWNIGRVEREFKEHYIENFKKFLEIPNNMIIYIPQEYEYVVWEKRSRSNTFVKIADNNYIKTLYDPFWEKTQSMRTDPAWYNITGENGWLRTSPQAILEFYNPIVQSKMFLLNDATIWDPFNTEYFIWLDAGITNTVYEKMFTDTKPLDKIIPYLNSFLFLSYPYDAVDEIHGFKYDAINRYAGETVKYVCRGGLFGGKKEDIHSANATYYSTLQQTLNDGYMGTEEAIFLIMTYREPHIYRRYALEGNGMIAKFIQALIDDNVTLETVSKKLPMGIQKTVSNVELVNIKTNLYILTFNFPEQLTYLISTMEKSPEWLARPHIVLIDNSTNEQSITENMSIASKYNMEYIRMDYNSGICGGRQKAAEHFHESDADYMFFFEDDMTVNPPELSGQTCRNGFKRYVPNLYDIVHKIMISEEFHFLKLSFTEVYFDNDKCLPWYNVPQNIRTRDWPEYDKLPITGLDMNSPLANYKHIKNYNGISYVIGDINYCNWPMIVSKEGNKRMFIDTKWAHPFEQTWSSHIYQLEKEGKIYSGLLLASPIWHERIKYYLPEERREN